MFLGGIALYYNPLSDLPGPEDDLPAGFHLACNYPNPFNPITTIRFDLPRSEHVQLIVYDVLGRHVTTLVNKKIPAGRHEVQWKAENYHSGLYFYHISAGGYHEVRKMLLVK
jgi:hypothetical protein